MTHVNRSTRKKDPELVEKTKILANSLKAYEGKDFEQLSVDELERFKMLSLECHTLERLGYKVPISDSLSQKVNLAVRLLASSTGNTLHSDVNYYEATNANERTANSGAITDPKEIQKLLDDPDKFRSALESGRLSTKDAAKHINEQYTELEDFHKKHGKDLDVKRKKAQEGIVVLYSYIQSLPEKERKQALDEMPKDVRKQLDQISPKVKDLLSSKPRFQFTPEQLAIARADVQEFSVLKDEYDCNHKKSQSVLACAYYLRDHDPKEPAHDCTRRGEVVRNRCKTACCVLVIDDKDLIEATKTLDKKYAPKQPKKPKGKGLADQVSPLHRQENATKLPAGGAFESLQDAQQEIAPQKRKDILHTL